MANKKTVLLVEDDESVRRMVRVTLEMNEYEVIEAKDGLEGLLLLVYQLLPGNARSPPQGGLSLLAPADRGVRPRARP